MRGWQGRALTVGAAAVLTLLVYASEDLMPAGVRVGFFYLIPVFLATWFEGPVWGTVVAVTALTLRVAVAVERLGPTPPVGMVVLSQLSFVVVAGIAIVAFARVRRGQRELRDLAAHDSLTRVLNARSFAERVANEVERSRRYARPLAVLYLDLDDFKVINDTHGHQTGDAVLRLVADAICRAVRQADVVGRLGGDEFSVLMPETDGAEAAAVAQRLVGGIATAFGGTPAVTASIGVVSFTSPLGDPDAVIRAADEAMYEAKRTGKNRVVKVAL